VTVGRIGRPFGIKGWVHVRSSMEPPAALAEYESWLVGPPSAERGPPGWSLSQVGAIRVHGKGLVARLEGACTREAAEALTGRLIALPRTVLPEAEPGQYYWADLLGVSVVAVGGEWLGTLSAFMETGANDVMVVRGERERLIPFVLGPVVREVNSDTGQVLVDWDPRD